MWPDPDLQKEKANASQHGDQSMCQGMHIQLCHKEPKTATIIQAPLQQGAEGRDVSQWYQQVNILGTLGTSWATQLRSAVGGLEGLSGPQPPGISFQESCGGCTDLHGRAVLGCPEQRQQQLELGGGCSGKEDSVQAWAQAAPQAGGPAKPPFPPPAASSAPREAVALLPKQLKKGTTSVKPKISPRDPRQTKLHSSVHLH